MYTHTVYTCTVAVNSVGVAMLLCGVCFHRHQQRYRHLANLTTPPHNADRGRHEKTSVSFTAHPPLVTASPTSHSPTTLTRGTPSHTSHPPTNLQELHNPLETTGMDWGLTYSPVLFHRGSGMWTEAEVEWDGDSDMSENVFPETFPQPMTSPLSTGTSCHSDTFSEVETSPDRVKRENPLSLRTSRGRSYSAIVPGQLPRHHSGRGHGHIQRASTGSGRGLPNVGGAMAGSPSRYRRACESYTCTEFCLCEWLCLVCIVRMACRHMGIPAVCVWMWMYMYVCVHVDVHVHVCVCVCVWI